MIDAGLRKSREWWKPGEFLEGISPIPFKPFPAFHKSRPGPVLPNLTFNKKYEIWILSKSS